MYQSIPIDKFTGLRLDIPPVDVGPEGAVDLLNVDLSQAEHLKVRPGLLTLVNGTASGTYSAIGMIDFYGIGSVIRHFNTSTLAVTDITPVNGLTGGARVMESSSSTTIPYYFFATSGPLEKVAGTTIASVAVSPGYARYLEVSPMDNRLVAGRGNIANVSSTAYLSRVSFSAPGNGDSWGADDWVDLDPLDGESITGMAAWGNELYIFKRTKFYIFYSTSTDATGGALFNYRAVRTGVGASGEYSNVAAGPDGVYFVADDGVYRTRGGAPERISRPIDPWFVGGLGSGGNYLSRPSSVTAIPHLKVSARQVIVSLADSSGSLYVYEIDNGSWSLWQTGERVYGLEAVDDIRPRSWRYTTTHSLREIGTAYTDDNGAAITWRYESGVYDLGTQDEKAIRQTAVEGIGTAALKLKADDVFDTSATLTLGTSADARALRHQAARGRRFAHHLSGTASSVNRVSRLAHYLRDARTGR